MSDTIAVKIQFGGGLELLFSNRRDHLVHIPTIVPAGSPGENGNGTTKAVDVKYLIAHLRGHLLQERPELFVEGETMYVHHDPS